MSTSAQIRVKGSDVLIYKHYDGYPSDVLPVLKDILSRYIKERGPRDYEYATAQIMRKFAREDEERRKQFEDNDFGADKPRLTGWGLGTRLHGDIRYFYEIDLKERKIIVKEPNLEFWDSGDEDDLETTREIDIIEDGVKNE